MPGKWWPFTGKIHQKVCDKPQLSDGAFRTSKPLSTTERCIEIIGDAARRVSRIQRINLINPAANVLNRSLATMKATPKDTANIVQPLIELLLMTVRQHCPVGHRASIKSVLAGQSGS
jgi:hypothetical protein